MGSRPKTACICHPSRVAYTKTGLCKSCYSSKYRSDNLAFRQRQNEKTKRWRNEVKGTPERKAAIRQQNLFRKHKITLEEYDLLFAVQKGLCAICHEPETEALRGGIRPLNVDHDHVTGRIRGLLCSECNKALGNLDDSLQHALGAAEYLLHHSFLEAERSTGSIIYGIGC